MNMVECCVNYAADASSIVIQYRVRIQHKHTNKQVNKEKRHSKITKKNTKTSIISV